MDSVICYLRKIQEEITVKNFSNAFIYASKIILGLWITKTIMSALGIDYIWAIISVVVVSDPDIKNATENIILRIINTILGCGIGMLCVWTLGTKTYSLLTAVFITTIISHLFMKKKSWRLAPATCIIVYMGVLVGEANNKSLSPIHLATERTIEIIAGCIIALVLSFIYSHISIRLSTKK
ncbi:MAG: FUSC family protein [Phycisphaerales bacterium]|nr:FUSC family protein [Phycisphaerales bacterium]